MAPPIDRDERKIQGVIDSLRRVLARRQGADGPVAPVSARDDGIGPAIHGALGDEQAFAEVDTTKASV